MSTRRSNCTKRGRPCGPQAPHAGAQPVDELVSDAPDGAEDRRVAVAPVVLGTSKCATCITDKKDQAKRSKTQEEKSKR